MLIANRITKGLTAGLGLLLLLNGCNSNSTTLSNVTSNSAYITNYGSNTVSIFNLNPNNGLLSAETTTPTGNGPTAITWSPDKRFAYVANSIDATISIYNNNSSNGSLQSIGTQAANGLNPVSINFLHLNNNYAYVANKDSNSISVFQQNSSNGALALQQNIATGESPVAIISNKTNIYVANYNDNTISVYYVAANGSLTPATESIISTGTNPSALSFDNSGKYLLAASSYDNSVWVYGIEESNGSLDYIESTPTNSNPSSLLFNRSGNFVYVSNASDNNISIYSFNQNNGILAPLSAESLATTGSSPLSLTMDSSGSYLYVVNSQENTTISYAINQTTGQLTQLSPSVNIQLGQELVNLAIDRSGNYLYATLLSSNGENSGIGMFKINHNSGFISPLQPPTIGGAGQQSFNITIDPVADFVYTAGYLTESILVFREDPSTGQLTGINQQELIPYPFDIVVDKTGQHAYVSSLMYGVLLYDINPVNGVLTLNESQTLYPGQWYNLGGLVLDPTGQYLYQSGYLFFDLEFGGGIWMYQVESNEGLFQPLNPESINAYPILFNSLVFAPSGNYLYQPVWNEGELESVEGIYVFSKDESTGILSPIPAATVKNLAPFQIVFESNGKYAYATDTATASVAMFSVDPVTGYLQALTPESEVAAQTEPLGITLDQSGQFAYVANVGDKSISMYTVNQATGALSRLFPESAILTGNQPQAMITR